MRDGAGSNEGAFAPAMLLNGIVEPVGGVAGFVYGDGFGLANPAPYPSI